MDQNRRFKANIAGKEYTIVGQKSAQHLNTVVDMVNNQLQQLNELAPELTIADRSILMAVNAISDQLMKEQQVIELEDEVKSLKEKIQINQSSRQTQVKKNSQTELFENNKRLNPKVPFERE